MYARILAILGLVATLIGLGNAQIYWSGNGHYYELVTSPLTWDQARLAASMRSFMGVQGHLLTISSQAENDFITANWGEAAREKYTGGYLDLGVWKWVTGEPWNYTNWAPGEPNGTFNANVMNFFGQATLGTWNDVPDWEVLGYFVEYDVPLDRVLTIQSANPATGVPITVYTADKNGNKNGTTSFTRIYTSNTTATLAAPANVGGQFFDHWEKDGVGIGTNKTISVLMNANHTVKAVFLKAFNITINSQNPASGVPITVWAADEFGRTNGTTTFGRTYTQGTAAAFTAPQVVGGTQYFMRWNLDGSPWQATGTVSLNVSASRTLTAVYGTGVILTVQATQNAVPIQIWARDKLGQQHGSTNFTRLYAPATAVAMTAPPTAAGKAFLHWEKDGATVPGTSRTTSVTMDAAHTMRAVYAP